MLFIEDRSIFNLVYFKDVWTTKRTEKNTHYISEYKEGTVFLSDMFIPQNRRNRIQW